MIKNAKGFSLLPVLLGVVIVGIIGYAGWFVYQSQKTASNDYSSQPSIPSTPTFNPYASWKTTSLKYEKINLKYPSTWQISNTSKDEAGTGYTATPGADYVSLTSPTGLSVSIQTGQAGVDTNDLLTGLPGATPIHTLGGDYFLVYYTNKAQSTTDARGACLSKKETTSTIPIVASKNITMAGFADGSTPPAANLICIYPARGTSLASPVQSISAFEKDASYHDAKLILESLTY